LYPHVVPLSASLFGPQFPPEEEPDPAPSALVGLLEWRLSQGKNLQIRAFLESAQSDERESSPPFLRLGAIAATGSALAFRSHSSHQPIIFGLPPDPVETRVGRVMLLFGSISDTPENVLTITLAIL
jgi:hypothetical protein